MATLTHSKNGVSILEPTGKIIGEAIPELRQTLIKHVDAKPAPSILINFERVHKMDSAGLGCVYHCIQHGTRKRKVASVSLMLAVTSRT